MPANDPTPPRLGTAPDWGAAAEAAVAAYCGWHPAPSRRETLVVSALHHSRDLRLPTLHLTQIHQIEVRTPAGWAELAEHEYEWDEAGLLRLARHRHWPMALRGIRADVTHGWDWAEVPDIAGLIHNVSRRAASGVYGIASQSVSGASVSYQTAGGAPLSVPLLQIEKQALDPYRIGAGSIAG